MTPQYQSTRGVSACKHCGITFPRDRRKIYCSIACRLKGNESGRTRLCHYCGCSFLVQYAGVKRTCCSLKCSNKFRGTLVESEVCCNCGKSFKPMSSTRPKMYCSRECRASHYCGSNHPLWRGNRRHERGKTFKPNARIVRERDKVCACCGKNREQAGQLLSVDHIIPFRWGKMFPGIDPNDLRNLVALCRGCHAKKTPIEKLLLKGKVRLFVRKVAKIIPSENISSALSLYGICI